MLVRASALLLGGALLLVPFASPATSQSDFLSAVKAQLIYDGVSSNEAERAVAWLAQPEHNPNPIGEGDLGVGHYYIFYIYDPPVDVLGLPSILPGCNGWGPIVVDTPTITRGGLGFHYAFTESALGPVPLVQWHTSFEAIGPICQFNNYPWLIFSGVFTHD